MVVNAAYRHFGEQHTGQNIASVFEETLAAFSIPLTAAGYQVTDNAKNMIKAFYIFSVHVTNLSSSTNDDADLGVMSEVADNTDVSDPIGIMHVDADRNCYTVYTIWMCCVFE